MYKTNQTWAYPPRIDRKTPIIRTLIFGMILGASFVLAGGLFALLHSYEAAPAIEVSV